MKKSIKVSGAKILAGAAIAGAGAYYLFGPKGKVRQKKLKDLGKKTLSEAKKEATKLKSEWAVISTKAQKHGKSILKKAKNKMKQKAGK